MNIKKYAIEVFFNQEFDKYVRHLWKQCEVENMSSFMNRVVGTEPHIALALYENIELSQIEERFSEFIRQDIQGFELRFDAIATFPKTKVTFLQPNATKEFVELMVKTHDFFRDFKGKCNQFYQPGRWFPHVTIGYNTSEEDMIKTLSFVSKQFEPVTTRVEKMVLVEI